MSRPSTLLDIALGPLAVIVKTIDELTLLGAHAELRTLASRLSEPSFRAMTSIDGGGK
jgi:hypothetical protein